MPAPSSFIFDGAISLPDYCKQWGARLVELEDDLAKLKHVTGPVTADDFGLELDRVYTGVHESESRAQEFVKLHPDEKFRDEAEGAAKAFGELETRIEMDPDIAKMVLRMTYDETASLAHQRVFVERWQERVKRSGAALPAAQRTELAKLEKELTDLRSRFSRNIADGQIKWAVSEEDLKGLPQDLVGTRPRNEKGELLLTTSYVDHERVMTFAESDDLRKDMHTKLGNVAFPANEAVFKRILEVTSQRAHLLGFKNHADYALTGRNTLRGIEAVETFINDTHERVTRGADQERDALSRAYGVDKLRPWQTERAKDALARRLYDGFDASQVQQYLRTEKVIPEITKLIQEVFGIHFDHRPDVKSWVDQGVECYDVYDEDTSALMGRVYTDLHPRENKYSHACASELSLGRPGVNLPEAVLICNLVGGAEAQMTFDEVRTLYHEYGHIIHTLCANKSRFIELNSFSTERDFVEAPSQFLEQHLYEPRILKRFAINKAGECITDEMISKLKGMEELDKGMRARTQLYYARLSLAYYLIDASIGFPSELSSVYKDFSAKYGNFEMTPGTNPHCMFGHLAESGYGPQYYCYTFAQTIAMDLLEAFKSAPDGLLDRDVSRRYRRTILEPGSTKTAIEMCTEFLGRPPNVEAFQKWISSPPGVLSA